jgi:hypothetical protein
VALCMHGTLRSSAFQPHDFSDGPRTGSYSVLTAASVIELACNAPTVTGVTRGNAFLRFLAVLRFHSHALDEERSNFLVEKICGKKSPIRGVLTTPSLRNRSALTWEHSVERTRWDRQQGPSRVRSPGGCVVGCWLGLTAYLSLGCL